MRTQRKNLLKIMLIAILAIQPAIFSYTMAGMSHTQHQIPQGQHIDIASDGVHHTTERIADPTTCQTMAHEPSNEKHGSMSDNCCDTAACGYAATLLHSHLIMPQYHFEYTGHITISLASAELATEIRPPRPHHS